ncbi:unnamed protein product [Allacma fusca]|uniref:Glutamate-gated chloride channel n=1 Tax=Allacma fusca TaxID=39272 RepID=A0A8J2PLE9_9HEXA|nr:unnamed protein product [Allacma fusca]
METFVLLPLLLGSWILLPSHGPVIAQDIQTVAECPPNTPGNDCPAFNISLDLSEKAALDLLLSKKRYDTRLLPPSSRELTINVSVLLLTLASPDESSLKYEVEFLLNLVWDDSRLKHEWVRDPADPPSFSPEHHIAFPGRANPRRRQYLDALHHRDRVWVPDVYFVKHGDFRANLDPGNLSLRIFPNGTITFTQRRHLILSCQGNLPIFPFDDPKCKFAIESISYEQDTLEFKWQTETGVLRKSDNLTTLNAYLENNTTGLCSSAHWRGNYSCLEVTLTFSRDRNFYFTTVFIPDIILVTSSFITFWLEWNAVPARVMLGVTTMLNFFTTSNGFRATLPVVSDLTAMNIWDGFSMFFIYASLLEFVFVNYIGRKRPRRAHEQATPVSSAPVCETNKLGEGNRSAPGSPVTPSIHPTEIVSCTRCGTSPTTHPANSGCSSPTWRRRIIENPIRVAKTIDVVSRIVFPIAYAIFLIYFFVTHQAFKKITSSSC